MYEGIKGCKTGVVCILTNFVILKIVTSIMAEKVELAKNDDIKDIKRAIKCINVLMQSFADNMKKLHGRMDSLEKDMDMVEILDAEMSNLRKRVDSFEEDMDMVEILGAEMSNLRKTVDSFEEDMDMVEILGAEMSKLRKTVADMKKSEEI